MDENGRQSPILVDNCYDSLPSFWLTVSLSFISAASFLLAVLSILTVVLALRKKRLLKTPVRTWVMNLDFISKATEDDYDDYDVIMDEDDEELKRFQENAARSRSLAPGALPTEENLKTHRSQSNMETVRTTLRRSDSDKQASFMLKVFVMKTRHRQASVQWQGSNSTLAHSNASSDTLDRGS